MTSNASPAKRETFGFVRRDAARVCTPAEVTELESYFASVLRGVSADQEGQDDGAAR